MKIFLLVDAGAQKQVSNNPELKKDEKKQTDNKIHFLPRKNERRKREEGQEATSVICFSICKRETKLYLLNL
jgi:hypothetical protein